MDNKFYIRPPEGLFTNEEHRQRAYLRVFGTPEGDAVLKDILNTMGWYNMSFSPQGGKQTAFNEGKKHVCRHLVNILSVVLIQPKHNNHNQEVTEDDN